MLLLGLVEHNTDPEWISTLNAVAESRLLCPVDFWAAEFFCAACGTLTPPPSSPTAVLLTRVQKLGIHVHPDGTWQDAVGRYHPGLINFAELALRLQWCWNRVVASSVSHRKDFGGLDYADVAVTRRALQHLPPDQQALMRLSLSGGLYTQDAHSHWNQGSGACKWCGQPDSLEHRYYHCPSTQSIRDSVAPDLVNLRSQVPDALALRSWAVLPPTTLDWLRALDSMSSAVPPCALALVPGQWNCVFTDGSCLWQSNPGFRVAAWSAVLAAPFSGHWNFAGHGVLCSGVLPGLKQTAFRSELYALCVVLHHAAVGNYQVRVFSDCLGVVNKFTLLTRGTVKLKQNAANADLWRWALQSTDRLGLHKVQLRKTPAHKQVASAVNKYEAWLYWHNTTADIAAKCANLDRGSDFWDLWQRHATAVVAAQEIHQQAWNLHLQVAQLSVKADQTMTLDDEEVSRPKPTREFQQEFNIERWRGGLPLEFANEYGHGMAHRVAFWWKKRTQAGGPTLKWVSVIHLYLDYQLSWGCVGPLQSRSSPTVWLDCFLRPYLDGNCYPFLKRVKWFKRCLKQFWRYSLQSIGQAQCRCESEILQSHVAAVSVRWDEATLRLTETWLADHCVGPVSRGTRMLQALPVAQRLPGMSLVDAASDDAEASALCA